MAIRLYNDGNTVRFERQGEETFNLPKPYEVSVSKDKKRIAIRANIGSVFFDYSEVVFPATTSVEELRRVLILWMSGAGASETSLSFQNTDIAGQVITGVPTPVGDYRFTENLNTRYFNVFKTGAADVVHNNTFKSAYLSVTGAGDWAVISTYQVHPYFAGFPIELEATTIGFGPQDGVEKEICYGNRADGDYTGFDGLKLVSRDDTHWIEIWNAGVKIHEAQRSEWLDPLDGTGASGFDYGDFNTFCVFGIQFLWLGGAGVQLLAYVAGKKVPLLTLPWSFSKYTLIFSNPQKPVQAAIRSTGGVGGFHFICSVVKVFGNPSFESGDEFALETTVGGITIAAAGITALIGWRLKNSFRHAWVETTDVSVLPEAASNNLRWYLLLNPIISGTFPFSTTDFAEQSVEYSIGTSANIATSGLIMAAGEVGGRSGLSRDLKTARKIGFALDGAPDTMVLGVSRNTGGTINVNASVRLKQRY